MSINLSLTATKKKHIVEFDLVQTPSEVTRQILALRNLNSQIQAYLDWVCANTVNDVQFINCYDDFGVLVDTDKISSHDDHAWKLRKFIKSLNSDGFSVKFSAV